MIINQVTEINAPIGRCFDLARSIDLHAQSTAKTGERAVAGVTTGLIGLGQTVTWRARHFGIWMTLTSRISACEPPRHFRDEMVAGPFGHLRHDHGFSDQGGRTLMTDVFDFASPLGVLGALVDRAMMGRYLAAFLRERNDVIKRVAESDEWRKFLVD